MVHPVCKSAVAGKWRVQSKIKLNPSSLIWTMSVHHRAAINQVLGKSKHYYESIPGQGLVKVLKCKKSDQGWPAPTARGVSVRQRWWWNNVTNSNKATHYKAIQHTGWPNDPTVKVLLLHFSICSPSLLSFLSCQSKQRGVCWAKKQYLGHGISSSSPITHQHTVDTV